MTEYTERLLTESPRKDAADRLRIVWLIVVPLMAILFQVYVPRFVPFLAYLELPLLVTVHFALSRGGPISAVFYGMSIGLVQDSLSHQPIGMYGIVKTLVGYFAASVSMRFDVENPGGDIYSELFLLLLPPVLLLGAGARAAGRGGHASMPSKPCIFGLLNAAVALPLFRILDKLKGAS